MKEELFIVCVLILGFCVQSKCVFIVQTDPIKKNCTFVLSNGDYEEFLTVIPLFENCTKQFEDATLFINLVNYSLPAFPNDTFSNLPHLKKFILKIFNGSQIQLLSPWLLQYSGFENLEFDDGIIYINDSANLNGWKWKTLSKIPYKRKRDADRFEFVATKSKLLRLDSSFAEIAGGRVTIVRIKNCQLRWLGKNVFAPLSNLEILELRKNFLEKIERSHLPDDASKLLTLDLGDNRFQYLPKDFFHGLKLQTLYLDKNKIKFLISHMDSIAAMPTQLYNEDFLGSLWPCDCSKLKRLNGTIGHFSQGKCYNNDSSIKAIKNVLESCKVQTIMYYY